MRGLKRGIAAAAAAAMILSGMPADGLSIAHAESKPVTTIRLKPTDASKFNDTDGDGLGEFEGWGTSLCWWANRVGYNEKLTDEAGRLFFSDDGLDMNIGRYNVGGGDDVNETSSDSEFSHKSHIIRSDSAVPGYACDVTKINLNKHDLGWYQAKFTRADSSCGYAWNYNWDADKNQINVLKAAMKASGKDFLAEAFSNSAPYFMTVSGCSSGNADANKDNLREDSVNAFAEYMADVIEHWYKNGIKFQSTDPMNEPYTNYWAAYSNKQEGCHFDQGTSQSRILVAMNNELKKKGIDITIASSDETSIDTAISSYNKLSDEAKSVTGRIDTHTYSGSNREGLKETAEKASKNLWMSEVDGAFTSGTNAGEMSAALGLADRMMLDVNELKSSAWILWNAIDMHADSSETGKRYVDLGSANDFLSMDTLKKSVDFNSGYWGLAYADHDNGKIELTKKYYGYGQFSRYIRPGYTIISSNKGNVLAAYDPKGHKTVIVVTNTSDKDKTGKFDLSGFEKTGTSVKAIRTSGSLADGENWADVSSSDDIAVDEKSETFTATLKANSITTYIVDGTEGIKEASKDDTDKPELQQIDIAKSDVSGSAPWNNGTVDVVSNIVDNDYGTFFDGVGNGYAVIDLKKETEIAAIGIAPRNGYADRCKGAVLYGSNDGENWEELYTVESTPKEKTDTITYAGDFDTENHKFRYVKYAVDASGNANLSELKIYEKADRNGTPENIETATAQGVVPNLPDKVKVGDSTRFVSWDMSDGDFDGKLFSYVEVRGSVSGIDKEAKAKVEILPLNLEYMIDCNNSSSLSWENARKIYSGLLNTDAADQVKSNDNSWGFEGKKSEIVGNYDSDSSSNPYAGGYWARGGKNISYTLALPAGEHRIFLGCQGWWSMNREMNAYYSIDSGKEEKLCSFNAVKNDDSFSEGKITLDEAADVTITIKKAKNDDPILSWIAVSKEKTIFSEKQIAANDGILYTANVGTSDPSIVPDDSVKGLYQSSLDQAYGEDPETGLKWGYAANDKYSVRATGGDTSLNGSYAYMSDKGVTYEAGKSMLSYSFELPERKDSVYTVTVGLDNPWGQWGKKYEDIIINGKTLAQNVLASGYEESFDVDVKDGLLTVSVQANPDKRKGTGDDPVLNFIVVKAKNYDKSGNKKTYTSIPGTAATRIYDNNGEKIQAHGGQVQALTVNGKTKYYWIGEDRTNEYRPMPGVHLYTSDDLYNWTDEGVVLRTMNSYDQFETDPYFKALYGDLSDAEKKDIYVDLWAEGCVMERPKMLYNEKSGKYVIWFHADGTSPYSSDHSSNYAKAKAGIAIADSPEGPFKLIGSELLCSAPGQNHGFDSEGGHVRDMNLFVDDDGTGYVMYSSEGNAVMYIAKLNDTYTGLAKPADQMELGKDFCISSTDSREGPAMFKYNGKYYLITSACTGWNPNQARYAVADSPLGPWKNMGDPCVGDSTHLTFQTQSTCVIPVDPKAGKYIYMGDRWYNPDNGAKLSDSRYVWLPIEFGSNNTIAIRNYSNWTLDELEGKGAVSIITKLPEVTHKASKLVSGMPDRINVKIGEKSYKDTPVTWKADIPDGDDTVGTVTVTGTLDKIGREVEVNVLSVPLKLKYFADCYTNNEVNSSSMFKAISENASLENTFSDQAKTSENSWGYSSRPGASGGSSSEDMGSHGSNSDFYDTGWWATDSGKIAYTFSLDPGTYKIASGYQEWWSSNRNIRITAASESGTVFGTSTVTVSNSTGNTEALTDIKVTGTGKQNVTVTIGKASGGSAPVLSWIGVIEIKSDADSDKITEANAKKWVDQVYKDLTIANIDDVRGNLTLSTEDSDYKHVQISWKSDNEDIITDRDKGSVKAGLVTRGSMNVKVGLTATISVKGASYSRKKSFTANVRKKPGKKKYTDYLFAYFIGEGTSDGEQLYFSDSRNGLDWKPLNEGEPVIRSTMGEKGLRDPFIMRSHEGDKFYMIATDLKINGGNGWTAAQEAGSQSIMIWESTDLVNWSDQRMVKIAPDNAGCTWAPEAFWDDDTQDYIVFWASKTSDDNFGVHHIYKCHTRDFVTFTKPEVWITLKNAAGDDISVIDTTILKVGKTYYRFSKNESGEDAIMTDGTHVKTKSVYMEKADSLDGKWTYVLSEYLSDGSNQYREGTTSFKFNDDDVSQDTWCLLLDNFGGGGYYPALSTDVGSGNFTRTSDYSFPSTGVLRHGSVINITKSEYKAIEEKLGSPKDETESDIPADKARIASFSFDNAETGLSGSGAKAEVNGNVRYSDDVRPGSDGKSIYLKKGSWLNVTRDDGSSLLNGSDEVTVSYYSKPDNNDNTGWAFYAAKNKGTTTYLGENYIGVLDKAGNISAERYVGGRNSGTSASAGASLKSGWKHVVIVYAKNYVKIYVNGRFTAKASKDTLKGLSSIFGSDSIFQIGKANWGNGEYYQGYIDDMEVYNRALTTKEIQNIYYPDTEPEPEPKSEIVVNDKSSETKIDTSKDELVKALFTDEEKELIRNGASYSVTFDINDKDVKESADFTKKLFTKAEGYKAGLFLDISIYTQLTEADGTEYDKTMVTEPSGKLTFSIALPETLINSDNRYKRTYKIARYHDGILDILDADFDQEKGTIEFSSDKFPEYAVIYQDTLVSSGKDSKDKGSSKDGGNSSVKPAEPSSDKSKSSDQIRSSSEVGQSAGQPAVVNTSDNASNVKTSANDAGASEAVTVTGETLKTADDSSGSDAESGDSTGDTSSKDTEETSENDEDVSEDTGKTVVAKKSKAPVWIGLVMILLLAGVITVVIKKRKK